MNSPINNPGTLSQDIVTAMLKDRKVRTAITRQSHYAFFNFYFAHYVTYQTAPFQQEIFGLTERDDINNLFVIAFRGSGKSTILTTSYPLWAILGRQQKKFVLILTQTRSQAKQHMMNMRRELEGNTLLKNDLGPFQEEDDEWGSSSLVFSRLNARITVASTETSIRGLRHNQHRPDLIIGDDVEDLQSTKTREGRQKTYQWLTGEVIPAGDRNTRLVIVGNLLHEDSLLMRIKEDIELGKLNGVFKGYPLIENDQILWPGKYPALDIIEKEKMKAGNDYAWQREYLLHIVPAEDQAIHSDWIQYYDELPKKGAVDFDGWPVHASIRIGIDLAISRRDTADYTAMISGLLYGPSSDRKIYILPDVINRRVTFPETLDLCKALNIKYKHGIWGRPTFIVENVAYQDALPQQLKSEGIDNVKTTKPGTSDKRSRLVLTGNLIRSGRVLFPKHGAEALINQMVHFGVEKNDDMADAFTILVLSMLQDPPYEPRIYFF